MDAPQGTKPKVHEASHQDVGEFYRLQEQFRLMQMELTRERKSRQIENANASMKIAWLEKAAASPAAAAIPPRRNGRSFAHWRFWLAFAVLAGIAGGAALALQNNPWVANALCVWDLRRSSLPQSHEELGKDPGGTKQRSAPGIGIPRPLAKPSDFMSAVSRLDRALNSLPGKPEAILQEIHTTNSTSGVSVCNFEWNDGGPAIVYDNPGQSSSLSGTLNACADAVEKFHNTAAQNEGPP